MTNAAKSLKVDKDSTTPKLIIVSTCESYRLKVDKDSTTPKPQIRLSNAIFNLIITGLIPISKCPYPKFFLFQNNDFEY